MNIHPLAFNAATDNSNVNGAAPSVAQLVAQVYEAAPVAEKSRLLEHLLRPLGVLALVAVADGVFATIRFRGGWPQLHVRLEDAQGVRASDIATLVDYVQQISVNAIDGLAQVISMSPMAVTSASAALLLTMLVQRRLGQRHG
ncbi:hypothetical protein [Rhodoferax sp.]|uniref:hypothetical protein n=1 Tax=Rhodoferax sp. TaxID=50421 RepID=UPI00284E8B94|nr:hypothetical protein [Rhodoferax sp.]MDR3368745.1 hypothetical protein [Rhodoferax sp.]